MYYVANANSRTDVIAPGAQNTAAYGINDVNVVIGNFSLPGSPATHGFVLHGRTFHDAVSNTATKCHCTNDGRLAWTRPFVGSAACPLPIRQSAPLP